MRARSSKIRLQPAAVYCASFLFFFNKEKRKFARPQQQHQVAAGGGVLRCRRGGRRALHAQGAHLRRHGRARVGSR